MTSPSKLVQRRSRWPRLLAAGLLLAALPGVVLGIYLSRAPTRPATQPPPGEPAGGSSTMADLLPMLPRPEEHSPFKITTTPKQWPADRMHEKINGEDEAYLKHGCLALAALTLTNADSAATIDIYLYQMATPPAARAVFDEQTPPDPPTYVEIGDKAYASWGSCYVLAGPLYLKLIASDTGGAAAEALNLARQFAKKLAPPVARP